MTDRPEDEDFGKPPSSEQIDARLRALREDLSSMESLELSDEELDSKAEEILGGLPKPPSASASPLPPVPDWTPPRRPNVITPPSVKEREAYAGLGTGLSVAYTIIGVPVVSLAAGYGLDRLTGRAVFLPWFTVIGSAIGVGLAVWMLGRADRRR